MSDLKLKGHTVAAVIAIESDVEVKIRLELRDPDGNLVEVNKELFDQLGHFEKMVLGVGKDAFLAIDSELTRQAKFSDAMSDALDCLNAGEAPSDELMRKVAESVGLDPDMMDGFINQLTGEKYMLNKKDDDDEKPSILH